MKAHLFFLIFILCNVHVGICRAEEQAGWPFPIDSIKRLYDWYMTQPEFERAQVFDELEEAERFGKEVESEKAKERELSKSLPVGGRSLELWLYCVSLKVGAIIEYGGAVCVDDRATFYKVTYFSPAVAANAMLHLMVITIEVPDRQNLRESVRGQYDGYGGSAGYYASAAYFNLYNEQTNATARVYSAGIGMGVSVVISRLDIE